MVKDALGRNDLPRVRAPAAQLPAVNLEDALEVALLLAAEEPHNAERAALRWLGRGRSSRARRRWLSPGGAVRRCGRSLKPVPSTVEADRLQPGAALWASFSADGTKSHASAACNEHL